MEEQVKRMRLVHNHQQQLEHVPELIHFIQSILPAKDAACTCVLSKSWLLAWSTIPTLRFHGSVKSLSKQQESQYMSLISQTLQRYHRDNLPIITCDLHFAIRMKNSASRAQEWIKLVTSKTSLKELCLTIMPDFAPFILPDEIFSSQSLIMLSLKLEQVNKNPPHNSLHFSSNPVINCLNLRVLELFDVHFSEEVLHNLFSTCKLLEKINLQAPKGLKTIKVNKLQHLRDLIIGPCRPNHGLEISDVPSLHSIFCDATLSIWMPVLSNTGPIGSLRELYMDFVSMDQALSDMINSKFPFLESLTLNLTSCFTETVDIRCVSLRRLKIKLRTKTQMKVQVSAPKLLFLGYECITLPSFLFPSIAPKQIELSIKLLYSIDHMFFIKMWDALNNLSSKVNININFHGFMLRFDIDDVRTRIPFPATNVEKLQFVTYTEGPPCQKSLIVDAIFSICRPNYLVVNHPLTHEVVNYFLKLNLNEEMENKAGKVYWPHLGEIREPIDGKWEALSSSSSSLLDDWCEFKINWCSP